MRTYSYISAAALAAALIATPQLAQAQLLGVDLNLGGESGATVGADVTLGGDSLLGVDADVNLGGSNGLDVNAGVGVGSDDSLVDVDLDANTRSTSGTGGNLVDLGVNVGGNSAIGPNGGTLIDLGGRRTDAALVDADVNLGTGTAGSALLNGAVRIGSLGEGQDRTGALLGLIDNPNLADIDLDAAIDDTRVSIVSAADLLGTDELADIEAAIDLGGAGRTELLDALTASVELGAILGNEGIDLEDVLAVQVAENGAAEVIVLRDVVQLALGGNEGDLAELGIGDLANLDIDLLSPEELAEIDLDLLPDDLRTDVQLRLLGVDGDAANVTPGDLANVNLDLLSDQELAELDLDLLPGELATAVNLRLLGNDGTLANLSVGDLAAVDVDLSAATDAGGDTARGDDGTGTGGTGTGGAGGGEPGTAGNTGGDTDNGDDNGDDTDTSRTPAANAGSDIATTANPGTGVAGTPAVNGAVPATQVGAGFAIAALGCDIGTLALASGSDATPQAIASADSLELVRIDGCERSLVDAEVEQIRGAISINPAISDVLDGAAIPLDEVIGATIQGGTLTLFIEPVVI